ncbi:MAG TPA: DNA-binding response regulator [Rhodospirillaceae bacterium]|nr:DNA-binding response regulator [Rhodospirillaceae bacterium]
MRLLIADDHALFRDAMTQYVERSNAGSSVETVSNLDDVFRTLHKATTLPELVLLDLNMPGMNGLEGFARFRETFPDIPVALLSGVAEPADIQRAMDLGAIGFFPKTLSGRALLKAIELVLTGEKFIPVDSKTNGLLPSYYNDETLNKMPVNLPLKTSAPITAYGSAPTSRIRLTPRENDVMVCLCRGQSNKDIARNLGLQDVTIKLHVRSICRKLDVSNRTQAVLRAFELGLIKQS